MEEVGFYNPLTKEKGLKTERMKHWLSVGAIPSATVHNMLISEKIVEGKKIPKHKISKKKESVSAENSAGKEAVAIQEKPAGASSITQEVKEEKPAEVKAEPVVESVESVKAPEGAKVAPEPKESIAKDEEKAVEPAKKTESGTTE